MNAKTHEATAPRLRRILSGPTASGKSAVAARMAERLRDTTPVALISMDSMLVYRGLDIVTAKPSAEELMKAPLRAIDVVEPSEPFSVARFLALAEDLEAQAFREGRVPVFVGGTGLYLKALLHGLFEGPPRNAGIRSALLQRAERDGLDVLHAELSRVDPASAERIHRNDAKRIVRALEVFDLTGRPMSKWQTQWSGTGVEARVSCLRVTRDELVVRIEARVDRMLRDGLLAEIEGVRGRGLSREATAAVGVREVLDYLDGTIDLAECRRRIVKRTRELARRQETWFRSFRDVRWIEAGSARPLDDIVTDTIGALDIG
jgi:tRNA dimethylallyltransferase